MDAVRLEERAEHEARRGADQRNHQRDQASRRTHEERNTALADRCTELEHELARERENGQLEIACLEEQVEELQSIVQLLERKSEVDASER